ncbi:DUF3472 domain-containing protein [Limnoglobus roseus]|uniref:Glucodextranase-like C-terminal domain-containing protein n=1 Tax=Limnoglobus roseus TaxID=2598579 RepID=A0A5C1AMM1_9BACT|nr:hypothetical protein [Limnoglobus roseus]QEL20230.1 hypothetical protein PX52LOC_07322 [Limnoglobus roseus]
MKPAPLLLALIAVALGTPMVAGDDPPKDEKKYAPMPWHFVDTWWDVGQESPFESLAVDVTISDDVPASVNLYIAPIGLGHLSKTPFYGGLQTQTDGNTKKEPKLRTLGPGFLFSMWGERSTDAIRPADGGFFQSSGHEGDFVSVRRPFAWKKGKYTYRLTRMDQETIDGKPHTWVGAFVYSHATDENVFVGALRFKGEKLSLDRKVANFVEIYGRRKPVADIPKLTITFGPPVVNGAAAKTVTAEAVYPKGVPDYAATAAKDGSLVVTVGQPLEGRDKRRVKLIEATK